jgi:hypothetical protein
MVHEQDFMQLNQNFDTSGNCTARIVNLFLIPTLIYAIVIVGYIGFIPLKVEIHSVVLIGLIYIIYLFFIRHNAYFVSCKFRKKYQILKEQLQNYINKNSLTIENTTKANASIDDFLKEFTLPLRNTNFSSVAAGIFPTLGILGTFISIAVSMPDFSSQTASVLEKEISLLLGGVGTAFYVSIYGIFLSIWWIFYEKIGMSRFEHDIIIIKENTKSFFWNKIDIEKIHFQKSIENYEKLNTIFNNIGSSQLVENMNNSLTQRLQMFDSIIDAEQKAMQRSNEFTMQRESQQLKINQSYEKITNDISSLVPMMNQTVQHMSAMINMMQSERSNLETASNELNKNIILLNEALQNVSSKNLQDLYSNILKNIETMKNDTDRIGWSFNQHLNDFDEKFTKKLHQSLQMIDSQTAKVISQVVDLKDELK